MMPCWWDEKIGYSSSGPGFGNLETWVFEPKFQISLVTSQIELFEDCKWRLDEGPQISEHFTEWKATVHTHSYHLGDFLDEVPDFQDLSSLAMAIHIRLGQSPMFLPCV